MLSSNLMVTFLYPFTLPGFPDELPAGDYEVLIQEEILCGQGFETYQRKAIHMTVPARSDRADWMEVHTISERDLDETLSRDQGPTEMNSHSQATLSPARRKAGALGLFYLIERVLLVVIVAVIHLAVAFEILAIYHLGRSGWPIFG